MGFGAMWSARTVVFGRVRPPYSGEVLGVKSREMLARLGYDPGDTLGADGFDVDANYVRYVRDDPRRAQWERLRDVKPPVVWFWLRTSPTALAPGTFPGGMRVTETDPPRIVPGMMLVETDLAGRLAYLDVRPAAIDKPSDAGPPPWPALFHEAGLDIGAFAEAAVERT